jgi:hypothetical protein
VTSFERRWVRIGNRIGVWMYRAFDGRLARYNKDARVLMITTPGRTTGVLHSTCVRYLDTPEGLLVWGTASGAPATLTGSAICTKRRLPTYSWEPRHSQSVPMC